MYNIYHNQSLHHISSPIHEKTVTSSTNQTPISIQSQTLTSMQSPIMNSSLTSLPNNFVSSMAISLPA